MNAMCLIVGVLVEVICVVAYTRTYRCPKPDALKVMSFAIIGGGFVAPLILLAGFGLLK